jgi:bleomycin hydrolase
LNFNGAAGVLSKDILSQLRSKFYSDPRNIQAQNVCVRVDPFEACLSRKTVETTNHVFQHKVEIEGKPVTNQKNTGRCWLFATLNVIRVPFVKKHNLEEFEFSQNYLFFWDKVL